MPKKPHGYWKTTVKPLLDECQSAGILADYTEYEDNQVDLTFRVNPLIHTDTLHGYSFNLNKLHELVHVYEQGELALDEFKAFGLDDLKYKALLFDLFQMTHMLSMLKEYVHEDLSMRWSVDSQPLWCSEYLDPVLIIKPSLRLLGYKSELDQAIQEAIQLQAAYVKEQETKYALLARAQTTFTRDELDQLKEVL